MDATITSAANDIQKLADLCKEAAPRLRDASEMFDKLKVAIQREGYFVVHHMHINDFSLIKEQK